MVKSRLSQRGAIPILSTFFISDLHLDANKPHLTAILTRFLAGPARSADALYVLGDLFEAYIGDDNDDPHQARVEGAFRALVESGVPAYCMVGNRDFLIREAFARRTGMTLIDDPTVVTIGGVRTLLSHGDRYCTNDVDYQRLRAKSRPAGWQARILALPLWLRRWIARRMRKKSMAQHARALAVGYVSDVEESVLIEEMQALGTTRLIHGHTHKPRDWTLALPGGQSGERIVLADWVEHGEALEIADDGGTRRVQLR